MNTHTTPAPAKRTRRKEARPGEIADAALALFIQQGFQATRMEDIARVANVAKGTVFRYFPSKNELFKAVVTQHIAPHIDDWRAQVLAYQGPTSQLIKEGMLAWWQDIGNTPVGGISRLFMQEVRHIPELAMFYQEAAINPGRAIVHDILQRGVRLGEFRPMDAATVQALVMAPLLMLAATHNTTYARHILLAPNQTPEQLIRQMADVIVHGLRHPQGAVS